MNLKNVTFTVVIAFVVSVASVNSWSDSSNKYNDMYSSCVKEAGTMNNSVVYMCSETVSFEAKQDMNKLYDIIYAKIAEQSTDDANYFEQSQRSWLKYRNSHCQLMGSYVGSPMYTYCPMELNISRVMELSVLAE